MVEKVVQYFYKIFMQTFMPTALHLKQRHMEETIINLRVFNEDADKLRINDDKGLSLVFAPLNIEGPIDTNTDLLAMQLHQAVVGKGYTVFYSSTGTAFLIKYFSGYVLILPRLTTQFEYVCKTYKNLNSEGTIAETQTEVHVYSYDMLLQVAKILSENILRRH